MFYTTNIQNLYKKTRVLESKKDHVLMRNTTVWEIMLSFVVNSLYRVTHIKL